MKKLSIKTVNICYAAIVTVGMVMGILGTIYYMNLVQLTGGILVMAGLIFRIIFGSRCPHCRRFRSSNDGGICQYCGKQIEE